MPLDVADRTVVVPLDQVLLANGLADARWLLHGALMDGARTVVVDLTRVAALPTAALPTLLWAHKSCRARGGAVLLRGASAGIGEQLHRTGLARVLRPEPLPA
jgi:anti-anti-sigma regulatory factor